MIFSPSIRLDWRIANFEATENLMKCPTCKDPNLVIAERSGIEIDYCPECRGIWLDRGELDKILERSRTDDGLRSADRTPGPSYSPEPRYSSDQRHHGYGHKPYKRKKSFLEELFD